MIVFCVPPCCLLHRVFVDTTVKWEGLISQATAISSPLPTPAVEPEDSSAMHDDVVAMETELKGLEHRASQLRMAIDQKKVCWFKYRAL